MDLNLIAVIVGIVEGLTEIFTGFFYRTYDYCWSRFGL